MDRGGTTIPPLSLAKKEGTMPTKYKGLLTARIDLNFRSLHVPCCVTYARGWSCSCGPLVSVTSVASTVYGATIQQVHPLDTDDVLSAGHWEYGNEYSESHMEAHGPHSEEDK